MQKQTITQTEIINHKQLFCIILNASHILFSQKFVISAQIWTNLNREKTPTSSLCFSFKRLHVGHTASTMIQHVYMQAGGTLNSFIQCQEQGVPPPPCPGEPHHTESPTPSESKQTQTFSVLPPIPQHHTHPPCPASTPQSWPALHIKIYNPF